MRRRSSERIAAACAMAIALMLQCEVVTGAFAFSPGDCGITDQSGTASLKRYYARLREKLVNSDPERALIGKLEKAVPIDGEPASQHYYWIVTESAPTYFDGESSIGQKILK